MTDEDLAEKERWGKAASLASWTIDRLAEFGVEGVVVMVQSKDGIGYAMIAYDEDKMPKPRMKMILEQAVGSLALDEQMAAPVPANQVN